MRTGARSWLAAVSGSPYQRAGAPTLIFVVTEDWYFVSHRLPLARAALASGYRVVIASRFGDHADALRREGFELFSLKLRRRARSVLHELAAILELRRLYRAHRPVVVHHVALKPVVFGSLAAWGLRGVGVVNALAGLGFVFSSRRIGARLRRVLLIPLLSGLLKRRKSVVIVQNESDYATLLNGNLVNATQLVLIRGAGVDLAEFAVSTEAGGVPIVLYAGRFLWDKGVGDLVEATRRLRGRGVALRCVLVGEPDEGSLTSIPVEQVEAWVSDGTVENWGRRADMSAVLGQASVVCLPSRYGEGVPKILLEAAAAGRATVTTDWPGCRDAVRHEETGLLVPPGDITSLTAALEMLVTDAAMRRRYGAAGRVLAEREFDVRAVIDSTITCYQRVTTTINVTAAEMI